MATKKATRVFGYPDIHWSDRDEKALAVAMRAQEIFQPDRTVIGGDLLNCTPFSRHPRQSLNDGADLDWRASEIDPVNGFLDYVQERTGKGGIDFIEGNHDAWFERWLTGVRGGESLSGFVPRRLLGDGRKNFRWIPFSDPRERSAYVQLASDMIVVHGWSACLHAAAKHLRDAKNMSVIFNHTHRTETRTETLFGGEPVAAWSAGCLCQRVPMYAHGRSVTSWTHGFWVAYIGRRSSTVYPVTINHRYEAVLPDGTEVRA